ncbi:hypothetical protein BGS_0620 [Beggiatoa sp. SS]|nr:hypothetical protein BGS_0620 [Beggiatoa sp. SS]
MYHAHNHPLDTLSSIINYQLSFVGWVKSVAHRLELILNLSVFVQTVNFARSTLYMSQTVCSRRAAEPQRMKEDHSTTHNLSMCLIPKCRIQLSLSSRRSKIFRHNAFYTMGSHTKFKQIIVMTTDIRDL